MISSANAGKDHGVFEELHGYVSGQVFADAIRLHVYEAHGIAGRAFVEALVRDMPHALNHVRQVCEAFMEERVPTAATGQVRRVAGRFALIGAAGELATAAGITGWDEGAAVNAAARCFDDWLRQRGTLTNADEARALAQVRLSLRTLRGGAVYALDDGRQGDVSALRWNRTARHRRLFPMSGHGDAGAPASP